MSGYEDLCRYMTRRHFFGRLSTGIGVVALAHLLDPDLLRAQGPLSQRQPHFAPRAKRVIFLFMSGGPSHMDLFDPKPMLGKHHGQQVPDELIRGQRFAFLKGRPPLHASPYRFERFGESDAHLSELLPHLSEVVDDIAFIRSMHTDAFNHDPAQTLINTGSLIPGRPSFGSWAIYGLGSEGQDMPGFVVLVSGQGQPVGTHLWASGFIPTVYQGVRFRSGKDPVLFASNPAWINSRVRRQSIDAINDLNRIQLDSVGDPEIETRIEAFELAFRMQSAVPELVDLASEPPSVHEAYGTEPGKVSFANNCLLARRLVEKGVRFVQLYHRGWDHHQRLSKDLPSRCREVDRPVTALIKDLKQRGLLESTLVVWGGEFGRTPMAEGKTSTWGRDHHPRAFTVFMAGGGIKPGITYGRTDDFGYNITEDPVHIHDLQATILHCLGLDHTRLTFRYRGHDFRLTEVGGEIVYRILA